MPLPRLDLLEPSLGTDDPMVLIRGYLSRKDTGEVPNHSWIQELRAAGWRGSIHQLSWDSSGVSELTSYIATAAGIVAAAGYGAHTFVSSKREPSAARNGEQDDVDTNSSVEAGGTRYTILGRPVNPAAATLTTAIGAAIGARYHWARIKKRATHTGRSDAPALLREAFGSRPVSVMGFSLGARVAFGLLQVAEQENLAIHDCYLVGGAVRCDAKKEWKRAGDAVQGTLFNVYNARDAVLAKLFRFAELNRRACGCRQITSEHRSFCNIDATEFLDTTGHFQYPRCINEFLRDQLALALPTI